MDGSVMGLSDSVVLAVSQLSRITSSSTRLPDGVAEPLADDGLGRLARAETGQPGPLDVVLERLGLGLAHPVHGHGHSKRLGGRILGGFLDGDLTHSGGNLPCCAS